MTWIYQSNSFWKYDVNRILRFCDMCWQSNNQKEKLKFRIFKLQKKKTNKQTKHFPLSFLLRFLCYACKSTLYIKIKKERNYYYHFWNCYLILMWT